ncbi:putative multicopperoxidase [Ilyonectria robusta]|uniref:putative multicopperoxidase n=1 Tax=Ilyonectria robusta TaxID=1079257 RepID=UPI001E8D341F|nr:putative multicopperoxidase [Ilyonectria robusta]KAH8659042.1 putative multicopperoxidase [Ilyonectria robusta]
MNGTTHMDGPPSVTQCDIPPGGSMTYNFTVDQPGTYWYHSHSHAQYSDGLRGPFIVHDNDFPYKHQVDHEFVMTLSDWYHDEMAMLIPRFIAKTNPSGAEPVPKAALMNETQNLTVPVEPGKTYHFRVINIGAFAGQYLWIEGHKLRIVEVDGVYTEAAEANTVYIAAAQRVSFLLTTNNDTTANFPIVASMDTTLFDKLPPELNYNSTGWLTYDDSKPKPEAALVDSYNDFDDMNLVPYDRLELYPEPDMVVELNVIMDNLGDGANYAFFNNITYRAPKVPTLYTALSSGDLVMNPAIYGEFTHPFVLKKDQIVQIVVNNLDSGRHPFHLHGHNFQAIHRGAEAVGTYEDEGGDKNQTFPQAPMRIDTLVLWPAGNIVLRFKADNPGIWLFHCHIEWHVASGLIATMVEAPDVLQKQLTVPQDHYDACKLGNNDYTGNAAANTIDFLDLSGQNRPPKVLPAGFTPRGIVALVFSCLAGILSIALISWYGLAQTMEDVPYNATADVRESSSPGTTSVQNVDATGVSHIGVVER